MNKSIRYIIEKIINFNPVDYQDEDPDLIDRETISNLTYKYFPKTKEDLQEIIIKKLRENINYPYLNDIDTSRITNMSELFSDHKKDYLRNNYIHSSEIKKLDLSGWDTSSVTDMNFMFYGCESLKELNISNWNMSNVTNMEIMFSYCESLEKLDLSSWDVSNVINMDWMFQGCSSLEDLDVSGWNTLSVTNMPCMFQGCSSLEDLDVSGWNTLSVTDMSYMFSKCRSLKELDISNWNTSNVTDMSCMFEGCSCLKTLNISGWNTLSVINMSSMFRNCKKSIIPDWYKKSLTENKINFNPVEYSDNDIIDNSTVEDITYYHPKNKVDLFEIIEEKVKENEFGNDDLIFPNLSDIDTSEITDMDSLFNVVFDNAEKPVKLDLSSWNVSNVTRMMAMFNECKTLIELDLTNWNTSNVTDMYAMFKYCIKIKKLDLSSFDTSKVKDMAYMFCDCQSLTDLNIQNFNTQNTERMGHMFESCLSLKTLDVSHFCRTKLQGAGCMFSGLTSLRKLNLTGWVKCNPATDYKFGIIYYPLFTNPYSNLLIIWDKDDQELYFPSNEGINEAKYNFDVADYGEDENDIISTNEINKLAYNYFPKNKQELIDIIRQKVKDNEFGDNKTIIPNLLDIDTSKITDMSELFFNVLGNNWSCTEYNEKANKVETFISPILRSSRTVNIEKPVKLDLSNWNVSSVKTMEKMFYKCTTLTEVDVSNWNTSNVQTMQWMFKECFNLIKVNVSDFNVSNVRNINRMFEDCYLLKELDLSRWNVINIGGMGYLFSGCQKLNNLDISTWRTSRLTYVEFMFRYCSSLKELDLSHFDVSNVTDMGYLCYGCKSLEKLNLSGWGNNKCEYEENTREMFSKCDSLREIDLTGWKPFNPTYSNKFNGRYYPITIKWSNDLEGYWHYDGEQEKWCWDLYPIKKRRTRKK